MIKLLFLFLCGSVFTGYGQEADTTKIKLGDSNMTIAIEKNGKDQGYYNRYRRKDKILGDHKYAHWSGLDIGVGMLLNSSGGTSFTGADYLENDPSASWTFNVNLFEHYFPIAKHHFGFVSGIGFNAAHYGFKRNYMIDFNYLDNEMTAELDTVWNYTRNRLLVGYLQLPVLFQVNTSDDYRKNIHIAFGVLAGVRIGSDVKRKSKQNGEVYKYVERGSFFLNPFKLDATLRLGYRNWGIFGSYNLVPLFETSVTQRANAVSFGLSFTW